MNSPDKLTATDFGALADAAAARRKVKFDGTINLGHVLTFLAFIAGGFGIYGALEKRITLVEAKTVQFEQVSAMQEQRTRETLGEIRQDVKDARRAIDDVGRQINVAPYRSNTRRSDNP